ncbi:MAG TPA: hypothetical protein PLQ89_12875 [Phycisphaerae bacterium]|nr:hypothetical protein [Phycisphaerae bacterium]
MWYVHEVIGGQSELRARFPTKAEADDYARQLQAEQPKGVFAVVPSEETAMRLMEEQEERKQKRRQQGRQ